MSVPVQSKFARLRWQTVYAGFSRLTIMIVLILVGSMAVSEVKAQAVLDVAKISCFQYLTSKFAPRTYVALWLSGYYHGKNNNTLIDLGATDANTEKVDDYCHEHQQAMVLDAVRNALGLSDSKK
jgi:acid stress chaperone HdeB